jgi:DNA polymerase III subunit epsilon
MNIEFLSQYIYEIKDIKIQNLSTLKYCVLDLEGTGINFNTEHVTQIAALELTKEFEPDVSFQSLIYSPVTVPDFVSEMTGITDELLNNAPSFVTAFEELKVFVNNAVLVTQAGYEYDIPLLKRHCVNNGIEMCNNRVLDTKVMFASIHPEIDQVISTNFLLNYYEIKHDDLKRHDALDDCILISRIFKAIIKEFQVRKIDEIDWSSGFLVRRFQIPGMYIP